MNNAFINRITINEGLNDNNDVFYRTFLDSSVSGDDFNSTYTVTFLVNDNDNPIFSYSDARFTYNVISNRAGVDSNGNILYSHIIRAYVNTDAEFDYANGPVNLHIRISNGVEQISYESATITLRDINEAPTDITLMADTNSAGAYTVEDDTRIIGTLSVTDPDAADDATTNFYTHSLAVIGAAAEYVEITENMELRFISDKGNYRFGGNNKNMDIKIRATDNPDDPSNQKMYEKEFTITIEDVNEAPTDIILDTDLPTDSEGTIKYITGDVSVIGTLTASDPDANDDGAVPSNSFAVHRFTLDENSQKYLMIENTAGVWTLKFKEDADKDFRYKNGGSELEVTITATDNPTDQSGDRNSLSETFTINVEEKVVLEAPTEAVTVDENGYFTFMQKGTIDAEGNYARDDDDLYLTGIKMQDLSATFTTKHGILNTGQALTNSEGALFDMVSTRNEAGDYELSFDNIKLLDLAALIEGLVYTAPDDPAPGEDAINGDDLTIVIKEGDNEIINRKINIIITEIDDDSSIIGLDNYLIHQDLIDTVVLSQSGASSTTLSDYTIDSIGAGRRLAKLDTDADGEAAIMDIDGHTVVGSKLHVRVTFDDSLDSALTRPEDTHHIKHFSRFDGGKVVRETNSRSDGNVQDITYEHITDDDEIIEIKLAEKTRIKTDASNRDDDFDYEYIYTFSARPTDDELPTMIDDIDISTTDGWEKFQKTILNNLMQNLRYTSGGFNVAEGTSADKIPLLDETLITIHFEDVAADKSTDEVAIRVVDDRGAAPYNSDGDSTNQIKLAAGTAERNGDFVDGTVVPVRVDYTQSPIDRLAIEVQSFINEENKITRKQTSSTADDAAEDGSVTGPTIIRYYMPTTTADVNSWHLVINGANHIDSPSAISDSDKRIIEGNVLYQFEKIANIDFQEVTDINTQRPDIIFMKGGDIKADDTINDALKAKTVIQELTGIPGHSGTHKISTIFFRSDDNARLSSHEWSREIGYALGLRNPTPQLGDEGLSYLPYAEVNSFANTIYGLEDIQSGKYLTPQGYDIAALQVLFGARSAEEISSYGSTNNYEQYILHFNESNYRPRAVFGDGVDQTIDLTDGGYSGLPSVKYASARIDDVIQRIVGRNHEGAYNILGNDNDNYLRGVGRGDTLDGGAGIDEAFYRGFGATVTVDLRKKLQDSPEGITTELTDDILINIENLAGWVYNDILIGNNDHNRLDGGNGGSDTLTGNGGRDTFVVDLGVWAGQDTITDFERGIDKLEMEYYSGTRDLAAFRTAIDDGDITLTYQPATTPGSHTIKISYSYTYYSYTYRRDVAAESSITINFQVSIADVIGVNSANNMLTYEQLTQALGSIENPIDPDII